MQAYTWILKKLKEMVKDVNYKSEIQESKFHERLL